MFAGVVTVAAMATGPEISSHSEVVQHFRRLAPRAVVGHPNLTPPSYRQDEYQAQVSSDTVTTTVSFGGGAVGQGSMEGSCLEPSVSPSPIPIPNPIPNWKVPLWSPQ